MALFTQVYILAVTPLPFIKFRREVPRLLPEQRAEEVVGEGRPVADSAGWEGASASTEGRCWGLAADSRGRAWPWPWPAAASSDAATEQRPDGKQGSDSFGDGSGEFGRRRDGGGGAAWRA